jgi:hypothetical protein
MDALLIGSRPDLSLLLLSLKSNFVPSPRRLWRNHQGDFAKGLKIRWRPLFEQRLNAGRAGQSVMKLVEEKDDSLFQEGGVESGGLAVTGKVRLIFESWLGSVIALRLAYRLNSACYSFVQPFHHAGHFESSFSRKKS